MATAASKEKTIPATTFAERRAIATAEAWRPNTGDSLENVEVIALDVRSSKDHPEYGEYPAVVYKRTDGTYIVFHAFHTIAVERLAELKTKVGSIHNLAYEGERTSNTRKDSNGDAQRYELYYIENADAIEERATYKF